MNGSPRRAETALAQALTLELLSEAGISPGMRVLAAGRGLADLALLLAEYVGPSGSVIGVDENAKVVAEARRRAAAECCEHASFVPKSLTRITLQTPVDAVVGRFFLAHQHNPASAVRSAAAHVRRGGRVVFQEWHYETILWPATSCHPHIDIYRQCADRTIETLRHSGIAADMGLRLGNIFVQAGLALPALRTQLQTVQGAGNLGYGFFDDTLAGLTASSATHYATPLEVQTTAVNGHLYLPLQVGAWSTIDDVS